MGLCFLQSCLIQQPEGQANAALIQEPASLSQGLVSARRHAGRPTHGASPPASASSAPPTRGSGQLVQTGLRHCSCPADAPAHTPHQTKAPPPRPKARARTSRPRRWGGNCLGGTGAPGVLRTWYVSHRYQVAYQPVDVSRYNVWPLMIEHLPRKPDLLLGTQANADGSGPVRRRAAC
jgi:hypothetical protein